MEIEPIDKLSKDLKIAARTLDAEEARYLVDQYYVLQDTRIRADGQVRAMRETREPHLVLVWLGDNAARLEASIKTALQKFVEAQRPGRWLLSVYGIGPVIAAGLLAHINIERAATAGAIWRFAGLDPTVKWEKGQKRPWNARLKLLSWKAGESFKKFSGRDECVYGQIYRERKTLEVSRNQEGKFKEQAAASLAEKNWRRDTKTRAAYEAGLLPDGRLDLRATRYATKLFLSHLHSVMYECHHNQKPPRPYVIEHLGHTHMMTPPGWPIE
jgi:Transposase IS116/IS110/IS902 family